MQLAMETFLAKNDVKMVGGEFATRNRTDYSGIIRIDDSKVTNHYKKKMGGKTVIFYEFDAQYTVVIGEISKARFRLS